VTGLVDICQKCQLNPPPTCADIYK